MAAEDNQNPRNEENLDLKDLWMLFLSKWRWFVISVAACLAIAAAYILTTPPTYTRSASLLIKEDSKGKSMANDITATFSNMGLFQSSTNVNNEIINFRSPYLMFEVVKRLHLETNYKTDARFYKKTLYGEGLPVTVLFEDLQNQESASLTLLPQEDGHVLLKSFRKDGRKLRDTTVTAAVDSAVLTPLGKIRIQRSAYRIPYKFDFPLYITRSNLYSTSNAFEKKLAVSLNSDKATVIDLSLQDVNIQRAAEVLNTIINVYNEIWIEDKNQIMTSTNEFINERLAVIESELGNVDRSITSYRSTNMIPDLTSSADIDMQQSAAEGRHIMELNNQVSIARYLLNYIRSSTNRLLPANAGLEEQSIQTLINDFNSSQLQRNRLVESSSEDNLLVKDLDMQLSSMRSTILSSIENYIAALNMQLGSSQAARSQADSRISNIPRQAGELLSSERQQKVKEALYLFLLQKREENELSQAFTAYNTRIVTPPEFGGSLNPTAPRKRNILLVALVLGLLLPILVLYLKEVLNTTVRGRKDLDNLDIPFVGEIPMTYRKKKIFSRKTIVIDGEVEIVVKPGSRNIINEAFRVARTNLEFMSGRRKDAQVIMVTSANAGSGKSFVSANLATALAIKGKKVLAMDLDLRKATLSHMLGKPKTGVSDYLSGQVDDYRPLIVHDKNSGLDGLPAGTIPPNPAELLSEDRLDSMVKELRSRYDYVFLDCPPVEIVTDADIVNRLTDSTLFVIRAGLLERSMLPEINKHYTTRKYNNMAIILNGTEGGGRYGYKYGYKYGYRYENSKDEEDA